MLSPYDPTLAIEGDAPVHSFDPILHPTLDAHSRSRPSWCVEWNVHEQHERYSTANLAMEEFELIRKDLVV